MKVCFDIADYFIYIANSTGSFISNLKLQKLVYYAQAWHLALYNKPLFTEDFEAWVHGPVIPALYQEYKRFSFKPIEKVVEKPSFSSDALDHLEEITRVYFGYSGYELELMTHKEEPWIKARGGLSMDELCTNIISKKSMEDYYGKKAEED